MQLTSSPLLSAHLNESYSSSSRGAAQPAPAAAVDSASISTSAPSPAPQTPGASEPADPGPTGLAPTVEIPQSAIDRFTTAAAQTLNQGNQAVVELPGQAPIVVEGTKPLAAPLWANNVQRFVTSGAQEVSFAAKASPDLSIEALGQVAKPFALMGTPTEVAGYVNKWYDPTIRAVSVAVSVNSFVKDWQSSHSATAHDQLPKTPIDGLNTFVEGAHIVTSSLGLAGTVASAVNPALGRLGAIGMAVAVTGDLADFAVNGMHYILLRDKLSHQDVSALAGPQAQ
jgi:hypothetical protein